MPVSWAVSKVDREPGRPTVTVSLFAPDCADPAFFGAQAASEAHMRTAAVASAAAFVVMREAGILISFN